MMSFFGTVKNGGVFDVKGKDGSSKQLISFTSVDALGNTLSCQMWPDDPQHAQLAPVIASARRQRVQFEIAGYSVRMRVFKDGRTEPQANFIVTNVSFPGTEQPATQSGMYFSGTVKGGNAFDIKTKNGPSKLISLTAIDEVGNSWPCQMWPDDPQHTQLVSVIASARRQPVQLEVVNYSLRMRKFTDGRADQPQVNFIVSRVSLPSLNVSVA
ncbi:hypothetical protein [Dictyobacter arantiisoli]|uniref:Uncharacterized protein n=1 Tax=Dictyobacter arantiisoli TaxID=2014874 RepID=A0A5A5T9K5_9CHLR|nr:hypothetical protein [Dictyobacter arantiisoli]GCF08092.1 hypothetical protein KDI_16560 [Dictyobacter arantiisoli]